MNKFRCCGGVLEEYLSKKRFKMANRLIPESMRKGRILDIGCGAYPYFLLKTRFREKYGLDKKLEPGKTDQPENSQLKLIPFDVEKSDVLPFPDKYFEVIVMLAVLEHIEPSQVKKTLSEIYRILGDGGIFVLTVPSGNTDKLLRVLSVLNLVSQEQIKEHKQTFNKKKIRSILEEGGFLEPAIRIGHFEFLMNTWILAKK